LAVTRPSFNDDVGQAQMGHGGKVRSNAFAYLCPPLRTSPPNPRPAGRSLGTHSMMFFFIYALSPPQLRGRRNEVINLGSSVIPMCDTNISPTPVAFISDFALKKLNQGIICTRLN